MATHRFASPPASSPEENALFLDILHEAPLFAHRKAARVVGSVFYCILLAGYATLAIGAEWIFRPLEDRISQDLISPVLCSCDVLLLLLTGIFQQYLVYQVHKIRLQGYYSFSQKLKFIVRIPFAITAYGTAAMLLLILWKPYTGVLTISAILRIIMVVEAVCAGCFMSLYISYIHQYNSLNSHPDVLKSLYSPLQPSSSLEGLRQEFCYLVSFCNLLHDSIHVLTLKHKKHIYGYVCLIPYVSDTPIHIFSKI
ncbi:putative TMEM192 family protein [Lupinus albus]|uniref:Putative TMEM192 family protein n=1 Tax=Lupinus albus TaxID=3870 RepID=A0A6A4NM85_LUPAL|nr:putative TMEM192 family protein [Lupinus albus]